jgi:VanZ family protein
VTHVRAIWVAVFVWSALLIVAACIPGPSVPLPAGSDLGFHAVGYAAHALLVFAAVRCGRPVGRAALIAVVAAGSLGVATEALQSMVPGRQPSVADGFADTVGAVLGAATGRALLGRCDA